MGLQHRCVIGVFFYASEDTFMKTKKIFKWYFYKKSTQFSNEMQINSEFDNGILPELIWRFNQCEKGFLLVIMTANDIFIEPYIYNQEKGQAKRYHLSGNHFYLLNCKTNYRVYKNIKETAKFVTSFFPDCYLDTQEFNSIGVHINYLSIRKALNKSICDKSK